MEQRELFYLGAYAMGQEQDFYHVGGTKEVPLYMGKNTILSKRRLEEILGQRQSLDDDIALLKQYVYKDRHIGADLEPFKIGCILELSEKYRIDTDYVTQRFNHEI